MRCENCGREILRHSLTRGVGWSPHFFCSGRCASEFEAVQAERAGEETLSETFVDEM